MSKKQTLCCLNFRRFALIECKRFNQTGDPVKATGLMKTMAKSDTTEGHQTLTNSGVHMKTIILMAALISSSAFAQAVRTCPTEKLKCKLEKMLPSGGRELIDASANEYDGTNSDEPSVEPDFCSIKAMYGDHNGVIFNVEVNENEKGTYIYAMKSSDYGTILPGDVAFTATVGKGFFYRYNDSLLTCYLSNN